jgi:hypothetical protein
MGSPTSSTGGSGWMVGAGSETGSGAGVGVGTGRGTLSVIGFHGSGAGGSELDLRDCTVLKTANPMPKRSPSRSPNRNDRRTMRGTVPA